MQVQEGLCRPSRNYQRHLVIAKGDMLASSIVRKYHPALIETPMPYTDFSAAIIRRLRPIASQTPTTPSLQRHRQANRRTSARLEIYFALTHPATAMHSICTRVDSILSGPSTRITSSASALSYWLLRTCVQSKPCLRISVLPEPQGEAVDDIHVSNPHLTICRRVSSSALTRWRNRENVYDCSYILHESWEEVNIHV
jgi:hypothetical protein